jgi:hypothetical protein
MGCRRYLDRRLRGEDRKEPPPAPEVCLDDTYGTSMRVPVLVNLVVAALFPAMPLTSILCGPSAKREPQRFPTVV